MLLRHRTIFNQWWVAIVLLAGGGLASSVVAESVTVGKIRVDALSSTLVRIEARGPKGFEDRATFNVVNRDWPGAALSVAHEDAHDVLTTDRFRVILPRDGVGLNGVVVESIDGTPLYKVGEKLPPADYFPSPADAANRAWVMADSPRIIPPPTGAIPPANDADPTSGWDLSNDAADIYVFIPGDGGYAQLRRDFLALTGPTPLPPLYTFGYWTSRWYAYSETSALAEIDEFRRRGIPLDLFVMDTDWRVGASDGYAVDTKLLPDIGRFINAAHDRHVKLLFNDHPEPIAAAALDPKELKFRADGLNSLLALGMDAWWYDRNWHTHLKEPAPGLRPEVWGMRLYHDVTLAARPDRRPLIMSNVDGIDNGRASHASLPAAHRFPIWWTGDTLANWAALRAGVANGVNAGATMLLPYVNEDCGGHVGMPSPELFVRFFQFGAFSPVLRPHTTKDGTRLPWDFGDEAAAVLTDYAKLRYRLLPTIYAAARRNFEDGTPILRRCDLEWPTLKEAADPTQYLFGDDLLVAPILESRDRFSPLPENLLKTPDGAAGLRVEYFANDKLQGPPALTRVEQGLHFDIGRNKPADNLPADNFSVRWTGKLVNVPETGEYKLRFNVDDGIRVYLDGKLFFESWQGNNNAVYEKSVKLEKGRAHDLRVEFYDGSNEAKLIVSWVKPSDALATSSRTVWIPPGEWQNLWTGERQVGPKAIDVTCAFHQLPLFARCGGVVLMLPQMMHTGEKPWDTLIADAFISDADRTETRLLYEDDGHSNGYLRGGYRQTPITLTHSGDDVTVRIDPTLGKWANGPKSRQWIVRLHAPPGQTFANMPAKSPTIERAAILPADDAANKTVFAGEGSADPGHDVLEIKLSADDVNSPLHVNAKLRARAPRVVP